MQKIILAIAFFMLSQTLQADGLAGIHRQEDLGNKICMKNHFHRGVGIALIGEGPFAKADAYLEAYDRVLSGWAKMVQLEYGSAWASWTLSESQKITCKQKIGLMWKCVAKSKPCKNK